LADRKVNQAGRQMNNAGRGEFFAGKKNRVPSTNKTRVIVSKMENSKTSKAPSKA
jgi:hypothetical protein